MSVATSHLAIDIGASSGRAVLGSFDGQRLELQEIHRFANGPVQRTTGLHWDTGKLFDEVKHSLGLVSSEARDRLTGGELTSVGIDTWGVDFGLLGKSGTLIDVPYHYRDSRTHGVMLETCRRISRERIYARTGVQFLPFNTLYQLLAAKRSGGLADANRLLFIPDLLNYWLTGLAQSERSIASTSQMYDSAQSEWANDLIEETGLPSDILPPVALPGAPVGPLLRSLCRDTGIRSLTIVSAASHDTASAVAAIPASGIDWAYISSGTWFLAGRELRTPIRTPQALAANFTNECGLNGTIRFQKNIAGLWLLQECQRVWTENGKQHTIDELIAAAAAARPLCALIDPDDPSFAEFGDMPERIRAFCRQTGQAPPDSVGAIVRCILESLALKCRTVIDELVSLTGPIRTVHLVGGGAQNPLLCQLTSDANERFILAGPVEATAAGNSMTQAMAHRTVSGLDDIRAVMARSFPPHRYEPRASPEWVDARLRFNALLGPRA